VIWQTLIWQTVQTISQHSFYLKMLVYTMAYSSFFCLLSTEQCCFINYSSYTCKNQNVHPTFIDLIYVRTHKEISGNLAKCAVFSRWPTVVITSAHLYSINAWSQDTKLFEYSIASARVSKLKAYSILTPKYFTEAAALVASVLLLVVSLCVLFVCLSVWIYCLP